MPRGGKRANSGRKKKPLAEKLLDGNPGKRPLTVLDFDVPIGEPLRGTTLLEAPDYLDVLTRKTEGVPTAADIYNTLTRWLNDTGCLHLINPALIEDLAVNRAAWFECEAANTRHGRIVKAGDGTSAKRSPYVDMSMYYYDNYFKAWDKIWAIVSQNSEKRFTGFGHDVDPMEALLSGK